jgi:hypothetical protein
MGELIKEAQTPIIKMGLIKTPALIIIMGYIKRKDKLQPTSAVKNIKKGIKIISYEKNNYTSHPCHSFYCLFSNKSHKCIVR